MGKQRRRQRRRAAAAAAARSVQTNVAERSLSFCCWNVNGLTTTEKGSAIADELLGGDSSYDVVGLTETHLSRAGTWEMAVRHRAAYHFFSCAREGEERRVDGRGSGGLLLAVRKRPGLKAVRKQAHDYGDLMWVQIDWGRWTWYVGLVYMPGVGSHGADSMQRYRAQMHQLQGDVLLLRQDRRAQLVLMGDFNASIGCEGATLAAVTVADSEPGMHGAHRSTPVGDDALTVTETRGWYRVNEDRRPVDQRGRCMLDMAAVCQLVVANGLRLGEEMTDTRRGAISATDDNGGSATLRRWANRRSPVTAGRTEGMDGPVDVDGDCPPAADSSTADTDRDSDGDVDSDTDRVRAESEQASRPTAPMAEGSCRRVLDFMLVSVPHSRDGSWTPMRIRPQHRTRIAGALGAVAAYAVSDHVPLTITSHVRRDATGLTSTSGCTEPGRLHSTAGPADPLLRQMRMHKIRWLQLKERIHALGSKDEEEVAWLKCFRERCVQEMKPVHALLGQARRRGESAPEIGTAHAEEGGRAGAPSIPLTRSDVSELATAFHAALWCVGEEMLGTRPRRPAKEAMLDDQCTSTRPRRRSLDIDKAEQAQAESYGRMMSIARGVWASEPHEAMGLGALPAQAERSPELQAAIRSWRACRKQVKRLCRAYDREARLHEWSELEEMGDDPRLVRQYWQLLQCKGGRNVRRRRHLIPLHTKKDALGQVSTALSSVLLQWTLHVHRMGQAPSLPAGSPAPLAFNEQHRQRITEAVREWLQVGDRNCVATESVSDGPDMGPLEVHEVRQAVLGLQNGKATGVDQLPIELVKLGGESVWQLLRALLQLLWDSECTPSDWSRGEVVPLLKAEHLDAGDPASYRPITLLPHLSKVYTSILNARLARWCEQHGVLHEAQSGFRKRRRALDNLYTLYTAARLRAQRKRQATYVCFVDFASAYDSVWRDGLWYRMHELGIRGKWLRVLREMYDGVESRVLLNGQLHTPWVSVPLGLRQGCVLSPLLFNLYINGMLTALDGSGGGTRHSWYDTEERREREVHITTLAYADDLVLLAEDGPALQGMLDDLQLECSRWRLRVNIGKTKVMVLGRPPSTRRTQSLLAPLVGEQFTLGGLDVEQVSSYKYLGVILQADLNWAEQRTSMLLKAQKALNIVAAAGLNRGLFSVRTAIRLWKVLVRSMLEYGCELWGLGDWKAAESLQAEAGRVILRAMPGTSHAAIRGELGWQLFQARRDYLVVRWWSRLLRINGASSRRLVVQMYRAELSGGCRDAGAPPEGEPKSKRDPYHTLSWSVYVHQLLQEHGLDPYWRAQDRRPVPGDLLLPAPPARETDPTVAAVRDYNTLEFAKQWRRASARLEQCKWRAAVAKLSSLQTYAKVKARLELEGYLHDDAAGATVVGRRAAMDVARLRCGMHALAISAARWNHRTRVPGGGGRMSRTLLGKKLPALPARAERVCDWCAHRLQNPHMRSLAGQHSAPVESEEHAVLWCGLYRASRQLLFQDVLRITGRTGANGLCVLKQGVVDLHSLSCVGPVGSPRVDVALTIMLGGLHSAEPDRPRVSSEEHRINSQLRQACKAYIGNIVQQRRRWQLDRKRKMRRRDPSRLDRWLLRPSKGRIKKRTAGTTRLRHPRCQRTHSTPVNRRGSRLIGQFNIPHRGRAVAVRHKQRAGARRYVTRQADDGRQPSILRYASLTTHT